VRAQNKTGNGADAYRFSESQGWNSSPEKQSNFADRSTNFVHNNNEFGGVDNRAKSARPSIKSVARL
jgi:hypothetical protein